MIIKKTGFAGKVVSLALKHSGAYDYINERIAEKIVDLGVDPNIYWRDTIRPPQRPPRRWTPCA